MAYTIYHADGTPVSLPDGLISDQFYDPTANPNPPYSPTGIGIPLLGYGFPDYGGPIAQSLLQMAEHFAGPTLPADTISLLGQLWFDKPNGELLVKTIDTGVGIGNWETLAKIDQLGNMTLPGDLTVAGIITGSGGGGNAASATKLQTPRSITATGDASWTVVFDGSTDVTAPLTLPNTSVLPGAYGTSTQIPVLTLDAKGRVLDASTVPVGSLPPAVITLSGEVSGSGTNSIVTTLSNTGVVAGSYTSADITVDSKGRLTSAISGLGATLTLTGPVTGTGTSTIATTITPTGVSAGSYTSADITVNAEGQITAAANGGGSGIITLNGDVTGSGTGTISTTIAPSGVVGGTYTYATISVDPRGIIGTASDGVVPVIPADFTGANQSLTTSGFQILPGGLIMQWGTLVVAFPTATTQTITFPQVFSAVPFSITITPLATPPGTGDGPSLGIITGTITATACDIHNFDSLSADGYTYFAVGPA